MLEAHGANTVQGGWGRGRGWSCEWEKGERGSAVLQGECGSMGGVDHVCDKELGVGAGAVPLTDTTDCRPVHLVHHHFLHSNDAAEPPRRGLYH